MSSYTNGPSPVTVVLPDHAAYIALHDALSKQEKILKRGKVKTAATAMLAAGAATARSTVLAACPGELREMLGLEVKSDGSVGHVDTDGSDDDDSE